MKYLIIEFPSELKSRTNEEQTNGKRALTAALRTSTSFLNRSLQ